MLQALRQHSLPKNDSQIIYLSYSSPTGHSSKINMMAVGKIQPEKETIYFVTFTCWGWLSLFQKTSAYDLIYGWFDYQKRFNNQILGYVIMPNHLHFLIYLSKESPILNSLVGNGKRFLAYAIINRLEEMNEVSILKLLQKGVHWREQKKGRKHRVFIPSFDAKICRSKKFILQKLHYMHRNPVWGKWDLVEDWALYPHSSASQYELGEALKYEVLDFRDLMDK
jgi:REP element-mobilizing transposase RayT